ncbi:amidohydrolase family protein [Salipaludibacillus sp. CUR1]|uniref:adenine deaminase C-terminal domain-containing protein n=1 Tax=Salipaludibacillus sp. CUR1 TaxID=2820003 RepID=UPI001E635717|nr:adenine deaminase C-terminal domain-containing protein [Salipaludibacillus sp. CUR1]MCE7792559.1 amidohydrolase family protein [Salipaludibacillus sp. CUR1]
MVKGFSHYWTKKQIREQQAVVQGKTAPTLVIKNATYLNSFRKSWMEGNIWIHDDRIVYAGTDMPKMLDSTEIYDAEGQYVVPGYIEHHAHPFQLYNPLSLAKYASERGTTTLINDNMPFFFHLDKKKALTLLDEMQKTPATMLWWARYDGQTELRNSNDVFACSNMRAWLDHPYVVQGGELTDWPGALNGDDQMLHWMLETKDVRKPIEGHLPGAGEKTIAQMAMMGVDGDHESMSGDDVLKRLDAGMVTSLRYSSIRPDLPVILQELHEKNFRQYDRLLMTTDGSPPHFMKNGMMDHLISLAVEEGVPLIEAVNMVTVNVATHYHMDDVIGMIAPGRLANLNFLGSKENPLPEDVLAKGEWVRKNNQPCFPDVSFEWENYGFSELNLDWDLTRQDFHFSMPLGLEMVNEVIIKPYQISLDLTREELPPDTDENFMMLIDRKGEWLVSTLVKGFAKNIYGFASSFSNTGDLILIGKSKQGLLDAFQELKRRKGGIVLLDREGVTASVHLPIGGLLSSLEMEGGLVEEEESLRTALAEKGYTFGDPIYSLLFFSATHLPFVRITQKGIFDVKKKRVLFPSIMR